MTASQWTRGTWSTDEEIAFIQERILPQGEASIRRYIEWAERRRWDLSVDSSAVLAFAGSLLRGVEVPAR